jgi:hypothetical protein
MVRSCTEQETKHMRNILAALLGPRSASWFEQHPRYRNSVRSPQQETKQTRKPMHRGFIGAIIGAGLLILAVAAVISTIEPGQTAKTGAYSALALQVGYPTQSGGDPYRAAVDGHILEALAVATNDWLDEIEYLHFAVDCKAIARLQSETTLGRNWERIKQQWFRDTHIRLSLDDNLWKLVIDAKKRGRDRAAQSCQFFHDNPGKVVELRNYVEAISGLPYRADGDYRPRYVPHKG